MSKLTHTFAICAYKESPYLEECIRSLKKQKQKSRIIIATSTPNEYISKLAEKYDIKVYVNEGEKGITQDWNFAYHMTDTDLVTIAHQDDIYLPGYSEKIIRLMESADQPLIAFSDYGELRDGQRIANNLLLNIKRIMLLPLRLHVAQSSRFVRRRILSMGNPIGCPAVTFMKENLPQTVFQSGFRSDEDWEAWEMISRLKGSFLYLPKIGMLHRIHGDSETSVILGDNARVEEDYVMFCKFWPKPIARLLVKFYSKSEKSNRL
ncbi:MAG: glycosyltransferase family 2 protein [Clostridia bacterium]|nr:glycosyltransferase family 2 protein [Clostridia bacterium]NCC44077.1 glycosyltransferase family 2 protein [Clostridia bacterium]